MIVYANKASIPDITQTYNFQAESHISSTYRSADRTDATICCLYWLKSLSVRIRKLTPTSKVISETVMTCGSSHPLQRNSAALLRYPAASTVTRYPTQSYHPGTEKTGIVPSLVMLITKYNMFCSVYWWFYILATSKMLSRINRYRLVIADHGASPQGEARPPAPRSDISHSHSYRASQSLSLIQLGRVSNS